MVTICTRVRKLPQVLAVAEKYPEIFCSVGTHPHNAHEELDIDAKALIALTKNPKVVAIGEAGLDYHYDNSPRDAQAQGLRQHIAAARETGLPLVIHSRDCDADMARILEEETGKGAFPAVLHCFTGGRDLAMRAIALGHYVSFTGILTFKNSQGLRDIAAALPADRILVETDAPYLAPLPYRGKRNEPAYVVETAKVLAQTRGVSLGRNRAADHGEFLPAVQQGAARSGGCRMSLTFTILGCGSSMGVPRVALGWGSCDPNNPKNRRRRCALLVERVDAHGRRTRVLVDCTPDLREQLLDAEVDWLDGVLITHEHADHTHGIDDLRPLFVHKRQRVNVWLDEPTSRAMHARFGYCFMTPPGSEYPPILTEHRLVPGQAVSIAGQGGSIEALPVLQNHGDIPSLGFRFGNVAYSADIKSLPADSIAALAGLDVWIVDALRKAPHPSHFNLEEALDWIGRIKPKRAILTNLHSDMDYETLRASLPPNVEPAYDRMMLGGN